MTTTLENEKRHATGAISTFVFTLSGETSYDLTTYIPMGYTPIGYAHAFRETVGAGAYVYITPSTDVVTVSGTEALSFIIYAEKEYRA